MVTNKLSDSEHVLMNNYELYVFFLQSSTGNKYLGEFLDVGGLFTLLEILNVNQIKDEDKQQAVRYIFSKEKKLFLLFSIVMIY